MKRIFLIINFIVLYSFISAQDILSLRQDRMNGILDVINSDPKFDLLDIKISTVYEIEYYTLDTTNKRMYCIPDYFFFIKQPDIKSIKKEIMRNAYINYGEYYTWLRPSNYSKEAIKEYKYSLPVGNDSSYKINEIEYFKIFKTKAIIQVFFSSSSQWNKYYFPFKNKNKPFKYYEIVKVIDRIEIKKENRESFKCDMTLK